MKESQFKKHDVKIKKVIKKDPSLGYTHVARKVLPRGNFKTQDLLRTYIRKNFDDYRQELRGEEPRNAPKVLIWDLETSLSRALTFHTGKQYIGSAAFIDTPRIISVAWKWLGEDKIHDLIWDDGDDSKLVEEFLKVYNECDLSVGYNSKNYDLRFINARAAAHSLQINTEVKQMDLMKECKRLFRLPGYSMKYVTQYFGLTAKLSNSGREMWEKIQWGTPEEKKKFMKEMRVYGKGDIQSTEDILLKLNSYMKKPVHIGVLEGKEKWSCPNCGSVDVALEKTSVTRAGTVQRIMKCKDCGHTYKINNTQYIKYLERDEEVQ